MPENDSSPFTITPAHLRACLVTLVHGPYADGDTAVVGGLAAEAVRYLNHAVPRGGVTDPATVADVAADLATVAYRLPQLLGALGEWLNAEAAAGRLADDHRRAPDQLAARVRAAMGQASEHADGLATALSTAHNLAATLHAAGPVDAPAA
jgi:hypothetical protein